MQITHFSRSILLNFVCWLVCAIAGAMPAVASHPPACNPSQIQKVFPVDKGFKLLLVPLSGVEDSDAALGVRAMQEMKAAFPVYLRRMSRPGDEKPWQKELSLATLDCTVSEHAVAEKIGRAAGADAVLWGRAVCLMSNPKPNSSACHLLPLGFLEGPIEKLPSPLSEFKLSLTLVHHELSEWGQGMQEANPLRTVDFPAQSGQQSYGLLNEVLGVYAYLAEDIHTAVMNLQMARETVTGGARGQAELDILIGYIAMQSGELPLARRTLERAQSECGTPPDACQASVLYLLAMVDSRSGDREQAVQRLTQAFGQSENIKDPRQRIELLSQLAGLHAALGESTLALHLYEKVQALYAAQHDAAGQAAALGHIAQFQSQLGHTVEARRAYEQALKLYHQAGDAIGEIDTLLSHAGVLLTAKELAPAEALLKQAEALDQGAKDPRSHGRVLSFLAEIYRQKDEPVLAINALKEAAALSQKTQDLPTQASSEHGLGELFVNLEDYEQAIDHLEAALPFYTRLDDPQGLAKVYGLLGWARLARKQAQKAVEALEQAQKYAKQLGDTPKQLKFLALLAQIYVQEPQIPNAKERLLEGLRLARQSHADDDARNFLYFLGALESQRGDDAAAVPYFRELHAELAAVSPSNDSVGYYPLMGLVFARTGFGSEALDCFRQGVSAARQLGNNDAASFLLRVSFSVALESRQLDAAEQLFGELRGLGLLPTVEASFKARLLAYRGAKEAAAAYQELSELAAKAADRSEQTLFRALADAGMLRARRKASWGRCPGAVVSELQRPGDDTPLRVGDVIVDLQGQCVESVAIYERLLQKYAKLPRLTLQIWHGEKRQVLRAPPERLAAVVAGF